MRNPPNAGATTGVPELMVSGLGFPEGPAVGPGGRLVFVDQYRMQLTSLGPNGTPRFFAHTGGSPNSCVLGLDDTFYVCQNGGTAGPWRAPEMVDPSIQWVREGGKAKALITSVEGIKLCGPNDLAFAPDGSLVFTDPGTYNPAAPDRSYIHRILPDGAAKVVIAFPDPVFPNGVAVEADGSIVWGESYTGHVRRRRPNGMIEDFGRLPGANPVPDGMKIGADARLYVADFMGGGVHVLASNGKHEDFIRCGVATTNCAFDGESLWITDPGLNSLATEATSKGCLWRLRIPGGGAPIYKGRLGELI
jgi:gluconolactonase